MATPRAVLYVRLSRETAVSTSIEGQNADLYALAEREGWQIVATFEDNGKSGGKQRENARAALDMLANDEADVLAVYAYDRWSRMGIADSADVIKAVYARQESAKKRKTAPPLFVAAREGIRSDQEGWEMRVAFAADIAQKERERMVARRKASITRMRSQGRNPGNGPAPFGYRSAPFDDGRPGRRFVPDAGEAEIVREIADRLIAGESATALARELTARAVPMPRSAARLAILKGHDPAGLATGTWSSSRVSQLWASEHLLGRITQKTNRSGDGTTREGEVVLDTETGLPLQAFEPVLDVETMLALRARFSKNLGRGRQRVRKASRLLSGLVYCGRCGAPLYVVTAAGYAYYRCSGPSRGLDCTGLKIRAEALEEIVSSHFTSTVGRQRAETIVERHSAPEIADAVATLTEQINATALQLADEEADVPALLARRSELIERRAALRAQQPSSTVERVDLGKSWAELFTEAPDAATKRGYFAAIFDHFDVFRQSDPERIRYFVKPSIDEAPEYHGL